MRMEAFFSLSITTRIADVVTSGILVCMESAARLPFGQTIFRFIDRFLWIVEKSVQWSLPFQEEAAEENGKSFSKMALVRPLPWILFLPGLILLRALRVGFNIGAFILYYPKLESCEMVKYLQKSRRRLRAIKTNGMKNIRRRKAYVGAKVCETNSNTDANWRSIQLIRSIQLTLSSLSCLDGSKLSPSPPPTKIKVRMNHESTPTPEEKSTTESASSHIRIKSKRKYSQVSSDGYPSDDFEEETIQAKIDRIVAHEESMDDDDFNPAELPDSANDSSSYSGESGVFAAEIQDIQDEANQILSRAFTSATKIIEEEPVPVNRDDGDERPSQSTKFGNPNAGYVSGSSQHNQEYHSPCKFGEEGDTAFYSPISSKSSSPDRTAPVLQQRQQIWPGDNNGAQTTSICRNGVLNPDLEAHISGSSDKTTNGHCDEKVGTGSIAYPTKSHYRGRRISNASRKKK